jgi:hypothetical protein
MPMTEAPAGFYFKSTPDGYVPSDAAASPWVDTHLSGVAMGGLLAHLIDGATAGSGMTVARLTVDILGTADRTLTTGRVRTVREGRRLRMVEAEIESGGRVGARAIAMLVRQIDTPAAETALSHPLPQAVPLAPPSGRAALADAVERRIVYGDFRQPGPGAMWVRWAIPFIAGVPMSPLVRAAMLGDMGSAIGSVLPVRDFTFANVDIAIHFTRPPAGEWLLIESLTETAGNGLAIVSSSFADPGGVYARGHQALFVQPRTG